MVGLDACTLRRLNPQSGLTLLQPHPFALVSANTKTPTSIRGRSALRVWVAKMMATAPTALGAINYLRPSNQLVLLLQKGQEFPAYPMELSGSVSGH